MALDRQFNIYSIDTSAFYTDEEKEFHDKMFQAKLQIKEIKDAEEKDGFIESDKIELIKSLNREVKETKGILKNVISTNTKIRQLRQESIKESNQVSIFDSSLTRSMGLEVDSTTCGIFVVRAYFYGVLENLIKDGFIYNGEKYIFFTASAGQIRTKRNQFIKESLWNKIRDRMTCGLTIDRINKNKGINVNKFLAYLALCCTASEEWFGFNIDESIVVDDFETMVKADVDYVNDEDYSITRKTMDVLVPHMDGCGITLDKTSMFRMPWFKGLVVEHNFVNQILEWREQGIECGIVKDIYGKEYDIIKDGIKHIFTKSQFKMYKYYSNWNEYKDNFKKYGCEASRCNEEEDEIDDTNFSYQMLQTLFDMKEEEMAKLLESTIENISKLGNDFPTIRKILGFDADNKNKNYMQQALTLYPELMHDSYNKQMIKDKKANIINEAKSGRFEIDGKYTFVCPDLHAFCEWLFLGVENPKGVLSDGEIFCNLYDDDIRIDCLRSPHLYCEHAIRKNVNNSTTNKYLTSKCVYVSVHDVISKVLMFDCDGDRLLLNKDKTIVDVAKRTLKKFDIVPLYYNMKKAPSNTLNNTEMYNGMISAYKGGNIGIYSNAISKICNGDYEITEKEIKVIKWLCMENNIVIDSAKTLEFVNRPSWVHEIIKPYTNKKLPYFFRYAKDKEDNQTENITNSNVNLVEKLIPKKPLIFKLDNIGKFDYRMLMSDISSEWSNQDVVDTWEEEMKLFRTKVFMNDKSENTKKSKDANVRRYKRDVGDSLLSKFDKTELIDTLIQYLYRDKDSRKKVVLWDIFGKTIVENIKSNIDKNTIVCQRCGCRVVRNNNKMIYCDTCKKTVKKEQNKKSYRRHKN